MEKDLKKFSDFAEMLKALAHPVRLCIVSGLLEKGKCNVSYMQSCLEVPQSTISQHLQKLKSAGIVEGIRNGIEISYSVKDEKVKQIVRIILDEQSKI